MAGPRTPHHVVVAGGGVGSLEAVLALRALAGDRVAITLLAPERHFTYRPLSVGEPFGGRGAWRVPLAAFTAETGIVHMRDALDSVDADAHRIVTQDQAMITYDALVLSVGTRPRVAIPGSVTFRGPRDVPRVSEAMRALERARGGRIAFVVPGGVTWALPLYELALMAGAWARRAGIPLELVLVTPEKSPLAVFGEPAGADVAALLADRGVELRTETEAEAFDAGRLWLARGWLPADVAISLPQLYGPALPGVPHDDDGFTAVDDLGRVEGLDDVYALGDMTARPVKQGGLAAQQADAAASAIAIAAGADVRPEPYRPVLRGLLLTGDAPHWLRRAETPEAEPAPELLQSEGPLWWPPHKIAGRWLAPWLASHHELVESYDAESRAAAGA